jgi:hypothetical protein
MADTRSNGIGPSWARPVLHALSAASVAMAAVALVGAVTSFVGSQLATTRLYEFSLLIDKFGLVAIVLAVSALFFLALWSRQTPKVQKAVQAQLREIPLWFKGSLVICFLILVSTAVHGFRNVHPEGAAWISTGHTGSWPVSGTDATAYLCSRIRALSITVLLLALILSFSARRLLAALASVGSANPDSADRY